MILDLMTIENEEYMKRCNVKYMTQRKYSLKIPLGIKILKELYGKCHYQEGLSSRQIINSLNKPERTIYSHLQSLKIKGYIQKRKKKDGMGYIITADGSNFYKEISNMFHNQVNT